MYLKDSSWKSNKHNTELKQELCCHVSVLRFLDVKRIPRNKFSNVKICLFQTQTNEVEMAFISLRGHEKDDDVNGSANLRINALLFLSFIKGLLFVPNWLL